MEKSYLINANTILEKDYFCVIPKNGSTEVGWYESNYSSDVPGIPLDMEYSFNRTTWHKYTKNTDITITEPIYFRGNNTTFISIGSLANHFIYLKVNNTIDLAGRINSLSKKFSYDGASTEMPPIHVGSTLGNGHSLFTNNTYIRSVANLRLNWNITKDDYNLQSKTYEEMFYGCINLIDSPKFECITTYYSFVYYDQLFGSMFSGCTSLVTPPDLSNVVLTPKCFQAMFDNCTSLITPPKLPNGTMVEKCYQYMFRGCTSLTVPPSLPSVNLAESCYQGMFSGCTALTALPALPATVLPSKCYQSMFYGLGTYLYDSLISTTQDSTYAYEFEITATSAESDSLYHMFSWTYEDHVYGIQPVINTTYYCKIPTLSE